MLIECCGCCCQFFNEDAINTAHYQMAPPLDVFSMPAVRCWKFMLPCVLTQHSWVQDGTLDSYRKYVAGLPGAGQEPPEVVPCRFDKVVARDIFRFLVSSAAGIWPKRQR